MYDTLTPKNLKILLHRRIWRRWKYSMRAPLVFFVSFHLSTACEWLALRGAELIDGAQFDVAYCQWEIDAWDLARHLPQRASESRRPTLTCGNHSRREAHRWTTLSSPLKSALPFQSKYRLVHPKKLVSLSKKIFPGSKYPINTWFVFEKGSTDYSVFHLICRCLETHSSTLLTQPYVELSFDMLLLFLPFLSELRDCPFPMCASFCPYASPFSPRFRVLTFSNIFDYVFSASAFSSVVSLHFLAASF